MTRNALWYKTYGLVKIYYEHYGNLDIPSNFKTSNGIDYDENGITISAWIVSQRSKYNRGKGLTSHQIELLKEINMSFEIIDKDEQWNKNFEMLKAYKEEYGNLSVPLEFKTKNGIEYDEDGINLYSWQTNQKHKYKDEPIDEKSKYRKQLLKELGVSFEEVREDIWLKNYNLAKKNYEKYNTLEMDVDFRTTNGVDYDENGILLRAWLDRQRQTYLGNIKGILTDEQIVLLKKIGFRFESNYHELFWMEHYNLAKRYLEYYNSIEIPQTFKTKDGVLYDEDGLYLGAWLGRQRRMLNGKLKSSLTNEQINLLLKLGVRYTETHNEYTWNKNYELLKKYYEYYGNSRVPQAFKTTDGIHYDEEGVCLGSWLMSQKVAYKGQNQTILSDYKVKLLDEVKVEWFNTSSDKKNQKEIINEVNTIRKQREVLNRVRTYLNGIDNIQFTSQEDIKILNSEFLDSLQYKKN